MQTIIITAATSQELALLARTLDIQERSGGVRKTFMGEVGSARLIVAETGIGKVNAASAVTALLENILPSLVINTGCAGAYIGSGLQVGDLAVASAEIYGDEGVETPAGWESLEAIGIPSLERHDAGYFNEFPLAVLPAQRAVRLANQLGIPLHRGKFVTVSTCSGTAVRGAELFQRYGALCESMEGGAVAHVCLQYGVDCLELRGISNLVEDRDLSRWDLPRAVEKAQRFILKFIETLGEE